jgi:hypothetical protein
MAVTESIAPVDRFERAVAQLETRLAESKARRDRLHADTAAAVLKAIQAGKDPTEGTKHAAIADAEVAQVERALAAAREQLAVEREKQGQADVARRWREAEALLSGEMADAFQKIQTGLDLLIAGHGDFRSAFDRLRATIPVPPQFWPPVWAEQFEGRLKFYVGARTSLFGVPPSSRPEILAGPDLVQMHRQAVREVLGDFTQRNAA